MKYRITDSNYYGLPKDMDIDGLRDTGELCATYTRQGSRNTGNISNFSKLKFSNLLDISNF